MISRDSLLKKTTNDTNKIKIFNDVNQNKILFEDKTILISIIIPLYNEERSIKNVLNRIPNHNLREIILIDDGSTDNSVKKVEELNNIKIKIIKHGKNLGYGAAILTGFKNTTGDIIITMDSDGQHNPEEITRLILPIIKNQADIVLGSRYLGNSNYKIPLYTRIGEFIVKKYLWALYRQKIGNNQSGFRAYSKKTSKLFENMIFSKFGLCTEILFEAAHNNLRIAEIPITLNQREFGSSYVNLVKILVSISLCFLIYGLKKFNIKKIVPHQIFDKKYNKIIKNLRKFY